MILITTRNPKSIFVKLKWFYIIRNTLQRLYTFKEKIQLQCLQFWLEIHRLNLFFLPFIIMQTVQACYASIFTCTFFYQLFCIRLRFKYYMNVIIIRTHLSCCDRHEFSANSWRSPHPPPTAAETNNKPETAVVVRRIQRPGITLLIFRCL